MLSLISAATKMSQHCKNPQPDPRLQLLSHNISDYNMQQAIIQTLNVELLKPTILHLHVWK